jgi:hypothetical protein
VPTETTAAQLRTDKPGQKHLFAEDISFVISLTPTLMKDDLHWFGVLAYFIILYIPRSLKGLDTPDEFYYELFLLSTFFFVT